MILGFAQNWLKMILGLARGSQDPDLANSWLFSILGVVVRKRGELYRISFRSRELVALTKGWAKGFGIAWATLLLQFQSKVEIM